METSPRSPALETLLADGGWVRALARRLIADPHAADDAVQDAWLAFAERRGEQRLLAGRASRAWFARVLTNLARMRGRSETARASRERAAARAEDGVEDPAELVARAELQQRVVAAVLRLPEPYRSTVLARSWRGLSSEEIARARGVKASTVRTWHAQALARLREELDRGPGGRATWMLALAELADARAFGPTARAGMEREGIALGGGTALGGLLMTATLKWTLGLGVAALLGALSWFATREPPARGERVEPVLGRAAESERVEARGLEPALDEAPPPSSDRGRTASAAAPALIGWVRTPEEDLPVRGAELVRHRWGAQVSEEVLAQSDEQGRLELAHVPEFDWFLSVRAPGYLERRLAAGDFAPRAGEEFTVMLAPFGTLEVRIVDPAGAPLAGLMLSCRAFVQALRAFPAWNRDVFAAGRSDERGVVTLADLPCGLPLGVGVFDWSHTTTIPEAARRSSIELVVPRPGEVAGFVRSAAGEPQPGVPVSADWDGRIFEVPSVRTDENGRYAFDPVPPRSVRVEARAPGAEPRAGVVPSGGLLELDPIVLPALVGVEGRLRSRFDFSELAFTLEFFRDGVALSDPVWTDADGRFSARLVPGPMWLRVSQDSAFRGRDGEVHTLKRMGEILRTEVTAPASGLELWIDSGLGAVECRLPRAPEGTSAEPPAVNLHYYVSARGGTDLLETGEGFLWQEYDLARDGTAYRSEAIRPGTYAMTFEVSGHGTAWLGEVRIEPDRVTDVGELVLASGAIRGRVVAPGESEVAGALVSLELVWAEGRTTTTDARGSFAFEGLSPGLYWLGATSPGGARKLEAVALGAGETRELVIALDPPASLAGRVLRSGEPVAATSVLLRHRPRFGVSTTTPGSTDPEGAFTFTRLEPGRYEIEVERTRRGLELAPGEARELVLELDDLQLELRILAADGSPAEIEAAELIELESGAGTAVAGTTYLAELLGSGRLRVARPAGPAVLLARVVAPSPWDTGPWDAALALGGSDPSAWQTDCVLPAGTLELEVQPETLGGPAPELALAGFPSFRFTFSEPRGLTLLRERTAQGWRFRGVPPGAALLVRGTDAQGNEVVREVVPAGLDPRLRWP